MASEGGSTGVSRMPAQNACKPWSSRRCCSRSARWRRLSSGRAGGGHGSRPVAGAPAVPPAWLPPPDTHRPGAWSHGAVGGGVAACSQRPLDHPQAEREAEVKPNGVADGPSREAVAGMARAGRCRHPARLPGPTTGRKPASSQVDGAPQCRARHRCGDLFRQSEHVLRHAVRRRRVPRAWARSSAMGDRGPGRDGRHDRQRARGLGPCGSARSGAARDGQCRGQCRAGRGLPPPPVQRRRRTRRSAGAGPRRPARWLARDWWTFRPRCGRFSPSPD